MHTRGIRRLFVFFLITLSAVAQISTSRVVGVVQDPTGAAVVNARVQLTSETTGATFTTITSSSGTYAFEAVQPGTYTVSAEAAGFRKFTSSGNAVTIGQPATVNIVLEVGSISESVSTSAAVETAHTTTSATF